MVKYTDYNVALKTLQIWLPTQPHLPVIKDIILERFIHAVDGDLEIAKNIIDLQYCMRNNWTDLFLERDSNAKAIRNIHDVVDIVLLPGVTQEGWKITLLRLSDYDVDKFSAQDALKLYLMLFDVRMIFIDPEGISKGEQVIFDAAGFSLKHLAKLNLTIIRVFAKFNQEAASIKIRDIHVINCPPFLDKILAVVKPFLKPEIYQMIKFHQPNSDTLYNSIKDRNLLPKEYGGDAVVSELKKEALKLLINNRDYLMDKNYWVTDEKKRPANRQKPMALEGNFKSLNVD